MKKGKIIRFLAVALASVLLLGSTPACKRKKEGANVLEIFCWDAGYGTLWCSELIKAFKNESWVKETYPTLEIVYNSDPNSNTYVTQINAGQGANTLDLIFSGGVSTYIGRTVDGTPNGDPFFADLTETVYNKFIPGEESTELTVKDKMLGTYVDSVRYYERGEDSNMKDTIPFKSYVLPWASGMDGILYNADHLAFIGEEVPLTTQQFIDLCKKISTNQYFEYNRTDPYGKYAIYKDSGGAYWNYLYPIWWGQYEGIDGYYNFFNGVVNGRISADVYKQKGKQHALQAMEDILLWDNGYVYQKSTGLEHKQAQTNFLSGQGVFYANGDWFAKEMEQTKKDLEKYEEIKYDIRMMKTPIISAITEKTPSIPNEDTLRAVIRAIDLGYSTIAEAKNATTEVKGYEFITNVTQDDYDIIMEARGIVHSIGPNHHAVVPSYALGKEIAFDFLRYMATDKAQEIYMKATGGASLPFDYDVQVENPTLYASFDPIEQDRLKYLYRDCYTTNVLPDSNSFPLVKWGNMNAVHSMGGYSVIAYFTAETQTSGAAQRLFDADISHYIGGGAFQNCLNDASLAN